MLNYEKRLVVVTYCMYFEGVIHLDAEEPTTNKVRPAVQAALVFAVFAHAEFLFVVRYFLCS